MGNTISYNTSDYILDLGPKGRIKGIQSDNKSRRYAGIPYALPPLGAYRWRKPRPLSANYTYPSPDGQPWDATHFHPICPQKAFHIAKSDEKQKFSEDCLIVNIWTPVEQFEQGSITSVDGKSTRKKWPVYIWIHGGWFQMGDPSQDFSMDPTELISTGKLNAIVVAIGYRLNVLGFLAGKALLEESDGESAGNCGLWDQRMAIEWVRDNIGAFGGDVDNITLAGRSAGAYSVHAQVLHEFRKKREEEEREPFHRFFMCSNAIPAQPKTVEESEPQFDELCEYFKIPATFSGTGKLDELRKVSFDKLVSALEHLTHHTFRPITDDLFIHSGMVKYQNEGKFAEEFRKRKMKILIGEVLNEETLYATYNSPTEGTLEALKLQISNYYAPATTDRILSSKHYALPETDDVEEWKAVFGRIISDGQVRAPSRALVDTLVKNGVAIGDIWRYRIAKRLSFITEEIAPKSFGVSHAMDRPFWNFSIMHGPTTEERKLLEEWILMLVAFVDNDSTYSHGINSVTEMKVATADCTVEVEEDVRWKELVELGALFASG